jgi:hypothetical protein
VQTSASYTLDRAVADWMREGRDGRSPSTLRRDERILRPVLASIGSLCKAGEALTCGYLRGARQAIYQGLCKA